MNARIIQRGQPLFGLVWMGSVVNRATIVRTTVAAVATAIYLLVLARV